MGGHALLIPFHFPPIQGSTGAFRSLGFANWLPEWNWRVTVLTVNERAYSEVSPDNNDLIKPGTRVVRAFALDARRHMSIFGHYPRIAALPDRWSSWIIGGVLSGLRQIKADRPDVIYTTYPVPSSHVIGMVLHKITGIPWIAEFRDPMVEEGYPQNRVERYIRLRLEKAIFASTSKLVVVTPSARSFYAEKSKREDDYVVEIQNGFDESLSRMTLSDGCSGQITEQADITILHSGILYDEVRNPTNLLMALHELDTEGKLEEWNVQFVFRGGGNEQAYEQTARDLGLSHLVKFKESVPYSEAYREMLGADALMLMQGRLCNRQIPAKFYEYCALQKPILCLADPGGDTGRLYSSLGLGKSTPLEDVAEMKKDIPRFLVNLMKSKDNLVNSSILSQMTRRARAGELAALLDGAILQDP